MTNNEKMNEQLSSIADIFKTMFTAEELIEMEKRFNEVIQSGSVNNKSNE